MPRIFVGVHSAPVGLVGQAIVVATQLKCRPPWALGPAHPATHAFIQWQHQEGYAYRLDAGAGGSVITMTDPRAAPEHPTRLWEVAGLSIEERRRMMEAAHKLTGAAYDLAEMLAQLTPLAKQPFLDGAYICTALTARVVAAAGGAHAKAVATLPDFMPESLAHVVSGWGSLFRVA